MRKCFSFVLLVAAAIAWFSVVAPAQESTPARGEATGQSEGSGAKQVAAKIEKKEASAIDEAESLVGEGADDLSDNVGKSVREFAREAADATGFGREIRSFLSVRIGDFSIGNLASSFFILLAAMTMRGFLTRVVFRRFQALARRTQFEHDDELLAVLEKPFSIFLLVLGINLAILALPLSATIDHLLQDLFRGGSMIIAVWALVRATDVMTEVMSEKLEGRGSALHGFIPTINKTLTMKIGRAHV